MVFPVVMYRCESWTRKKVEHWRIGAFELCCWRRLLRVLWTAQRSNQSILKEISPAFSLVGLMLKLKLQYFGHLMHGVDSLEKPWCWERLRVGGEGDKEDEMVRWHYQLDGHGFGWTPWVGDGQGIWRIATPMVTKNQTWLSYWTEPNWTHPFILILFVSYEGETVEFVVFTYVSKLADYCIVTFKNVCCGWKWATLPQTAQQILIKVCPKFLPPILTFINHVFISKQAQNHSSPSFCPLEWTAMSY